MRLLHVVRRDVRTHASEYAVAGAMVGVALVALVTRIDVRDADLDLFRHDTWWSWAVTIAGCAVLVGRRRWPLRTLAIELVLVMSLELGRHRDSVAFFALVIALYSVAAHLPLRSAARGVAMVAAAYVALVLGGTTIITAAPVAGPLFFSTAFALGRLLRRSRSRQERAVEAAIERGAAAVETADQQAADERLRMSRELHDVVAHSLSVIAVQAGIGVHLIDRQPGDAARALDAIRTTSRTTAAELTRLVDVLRDGDSAAHVPAPSLNHLPELMDGIRSAGVPVTLTTAGDLGAVPAGVSLAAYRIVQEALTNVVRHAGHAEAIVAVRAADDHVSLCVEDDGRGTTVALDSAGLRGGHGLIGMSERARMYGGELGTGPRPGGGFRVQATLRYFPSPSNGDPSADPVSDSTGTGRAATSLRRPDVCVWDVLLATLMAVLVAAEIIGSPLTAAGQLFSSPDLREWLLKLGCCLALVGRRRWPTVSLAAICLLTLVLNYGGYQLGVIFFALLIGVYAVANNSSGRRLVAALMVVFVEMAMLASSTPPQAAAGAAVWVGIFVGATAIAGYVARRDREQSSTELAEREDAVDARSRRALLVITTERLRIADELSAIIRRSLHAITHEAGEGSQLVFADPVAARRALEAISATSRDALNDLRLLLRRIRTEDEPALYAPVTATLPAVPAGEAR